MSFGIKLAVGDEATPYLKELERRLGSRADLHRILATEAKTIFQKHISDHATHKWARQLGGKSTGHREATVRAITAESNSDYALIMIPAASGMGRAFHDVTLVPGSGKKWLTLPATGTTYGRRASEIEGLKFVKFREDLAGLVKRNKSDAKFTVFYWLKKEIRQKQDRNLLPSDEILTEQLEESVLEWLMATPKQGGGAA